MNIVCDYGWQRCGNIRVGIDRQTDRRIDGWTDGQTDRQIDTLLSFSGNVFSLVVNVFVLIVRVGGVGFLVVFFA